MNYTGVVGLDASRNYRRGGGGVGGKHKEAPIRTKKPPHGKKCPPTSEKGSKRRPIHIAIFILIFQGGACLPSTVGAHLKS